jgi:hypothetical protein
MTQGYGRSGGVPVFCGGSISEYNWPRIWGCIRSFGNVLDAKVMIKDFCPDDFASCFETEEFLWFFLFILLIDWVKLYCHHRNCEFSLHPKKHLMMRLLLTSGLSFFKKWNVYK